MSSRHRPENAYEDNKHRPRHGGVRKQSNRVVSVSQTFGHNARADDGHQQEGRTDHLGRKSSRERHLLRTSPIAR
jgi:hypothetical protein